MRQLRPARRPLEKRRLAADPGHDDRFAAFDHPPDDALAELVADRMRRTVKSVTGLNAQLPVLEKRDQPADRPVALAQNLDDAVERRLEIERPGEGLADVEERR